MSKKPPRWLREQCSRYTELAMNATAKCTVRRKSGWRVCRKESQSVSELIVGIDLGTTNSEVAAYVNGRVRVLGPGEDKMLPSCVGLSPNGELLVGEAARNQQLIYPERTIR